MKFAAFFFTILLFANSAIAQTAIRSFLATDYIEGHLHRSSTAVSVHLSKDHKIYRLTGTNTEVLEVLSRLGNYDFIRGTGEIRADQVILQSIEFIGLKALLGKWSFRGGTLTVHDFLTATFYFEKTGQREKFTYSLAIGEAAPWRILTSDGKTVTLGDLEIDRDRLKIQFVDMDTGEPKKALELTRKWPPDP